MEKLKAELCECGHVNDAHVNYWGFCIICHENLRQCVEYRPVKPKRKAGK